MLSDVTILITSFLRPGYLADCLVGIKSNLPECQVIVVDDGDLAEVTGEGIISMPFDSGLSAKRNCGVAATKTRYLLMGSDDFDFSTEEARQGIEKMVAVLNEYPDIDVAGGHVNGQVYEGNLTVAPGQYIAQSYLASSSEITKCDLVVNYFVARVQSIRPYPWDERMKIGGEHGDWFLTLKDNGLKVVAISDVNINTLPVDATKEDARYSRFRARAKNLGHKVFLRKRGVSQFFSAGELPPVPLKLPKFLVAIVSCHKYQFKVNALRKTWLSSLYKIDYKIFYGRGAKRQPLSDEVFLDVKDDYVSLPVKMKAIYKWALDHGYDYICKVDDDVFVEVPRLVTAGWQNYAYSGRANTSGNTPWASGACYWLNKNAMQILVEEPLGKDTAEDRTVGTVLGRHGIYVQDDGRYALVIHCQPGWESAITACICHPKITMQMLAEGFETQMCPEMDKVFPQHSIPTFNPPSSSPVVPTTPIPPPPPAPNPNWTEDFLDRKVQALFGRFRYAVATEPKSSHYKSLCQVYPEHIEERVETVNGPRIIFVVEK